MPAPADPLGTDACVLACRAVGRETADGVGRWLLSPGWPTPQAAAQAKVHHRSPGSQLFRLLLGP